MAFKSIDTHLAKFNSAFSSEFLDKYEAFVDSQILARRSEKKKQTFAPSSMYCPLQQWFRLRGAEPDEIETADKALEFTAVMGTACHEEIQRNLSQLYGSNWLNVGDYIKTIYPEGTYTVTNNGFETLIEFFNPPVRFAVDGLIQFPGEKILLEIKSSDHGSFIELTDPKPKHIYQAKTYCALLKVDRIIFMYQDRQYGDIKCFEVRVPQYEKDAILKQMTEIQEMVDANLAPEGLPKGDSRCSSNMCPYYKKCKSWRM